MYASQPLAILLYQASEASSWTLIASTLASDLKDAVEAVPVKLKIRQPDEKAGYAAKRAAAVKAE